jgi:hypothetical protein
MAVWYNNQWHEDKTTITIVTNEVEALTIGHAWQTTGAFVLYRDNQGNPMIEGPYHHLEPAYMEMIA